MAKVIFFIVPTECHINPTLPIVAELVRRGEQITYYGTEPFRARIEETGATFRLYDGNFDLEHEPESPITLSIELIQHTRQLMPLLLTELGKNPPDLIIHDTMSAWGWMLAQILDIPAIASAALMLFNPTILMRTGKMYNLMRSTLSSMSLIQKYREITDALESTYGVKFPGVLDVLNLTGGLTISYTTELFQPFASSFGSGLRFIGPSVGPAQAQSPGLSKKFNPQKPLIYIDGESTAKHRNFMDDVFSVLAEMPVQMVISANGMLKKRPVNVLTVPQSAHYEVLQQSALYITASTMRQTHEALFYNIPLLMLPATTMQSLIAGQVVNHGAGVIVDNPDIPAEKIHELIVSALKNPELAQNAALLGASMRNAGGYLRAVDEIQAFQHKQTPYSRT